MIIIKGTRLLQHGGCFSVPEYLMHVANGVILGSSLQNYKKSLEGLAQENNILSSSMVRLFQVSLRSFVFVIQFDE